MFVYVAGWRFREQNWERRLALGRRAAWEQLVTVPALEEWQDPSPPLTLYLTGVCLFMLVTCLSFEKLAFYSYFSLILIFWKTLRVSERALTMRSRWTLKLNPVICV